MPKAKLTLAGIIFAVLAVLGSYFCNAAETWRGNDTDEIARIISTGKNTNKSMQHLARLTKDIGSRPVGSANFLKACKWAHDEFQNFGLENVHLEQCGEIKGVYPNDGTSAFFKRYTSSTFKGGADNEMVPIFNVIADIPGKELSDEYVIIGAHLDSAPQGPGATDNGAGVAAVMEAARMLVVSKANFGGQFDSFFLAVKKPGSWDPKGMLNPTVKPYQKYQLFIIWITAQTSSRALSLQNPWQTTCVKYSQWPGNWIPTCLLK